MSESSPSFDSAPQPDPAGVPAGFVLRDVGGPYFRALGPVYMKARPEGGAVLGLRITNGHLNIQGVTHGGMLTTLADGALGLNIAMARGKRGGQVTVSLTADFLSGGRLGDWLEAHVTVTRMGQRLAYASCDLRVADRHVLRASAVFAFVDRPLPASLPSLEPPLADG